MDPSSKRTKSVTSNGGPAWRECQVLRHAMTRMKAPPAEWQQPNGEMWNMARYVIHLECIRCGVHRALAVDVHGGWLASKYDGYPDGYLQPKGEGPVDRDNLRLWLAGKVKL